MTQAMANLIPRPDTEKNTKKQRECHLQYVPLQQEPPRERLSEETDYGRDRYQEPVSDTGQHRLRNFDRLLFYYLM